MLSMCYAISKSAEEADRIWWDMPLCKVWAMLHCYLFGQGIDVQYMADKSQISKYLSKHHDKNLRKKPAYERNLEEIEYIR